MMNHIYDPTISWETLSNPAYTALTTTHKKFALQSSTALRYAPELSAFAGMPDPPTEDNWNDLAQFLGPGETLMTIFADAIDIPDSLFTITNVIHGDRFLGDKVESISLDEITAELPNYHVQKLDISNNSQILELYSLARPGPFFSRTVTMGNFYGLFHHGQLVTVVGQRIAPGDFIEISGVSTHPHHQGKGLASRLIRYAVADIQRAHKTPFLYVSASNIDARKVYEKLGFDKPHKESFYELALTS